MVIDIITYELAEGVTESDLRAAAADIVEVWMKKQTGFLKWEINKDAEGDGYTDFVHWSSMADADAATAAMGDIPTDHAWLGCYDMSTIKAQKVENVSVLKNAL